MRSPQPTGARPASHPDAFLDASSASRTATTFRARLLAAGRSLGAHVRRELRDQRAILFGVFVALPVLTLLAFWAFADRLVEAPVDTACAWAVPPIALGLFLLAVVGDVFAGESRRGTIAFLRRLPGGMRHAFAAKLLVTLVGSALTIVWQALLLWTSWWLWSRSYLPTAGGVVHAAFTSPFLLPVATVGAFVLLASTWLQHGGMAILLAPMLLGALLAPAVVWGRANPGLARWLLGDPWDVLLPAALGVAAAAVLAAAASFLRGLCVVRPVWSAAWRGLVVLLVLFGGAYAFGAWHVQDRLDFAPGDDDVVITQAYLGRDGRLLFVTAGPEDLGGRLGHTDLTRCWVVDVESGATRALGPAFSRFRLPPHAGGWASHLGWSRTFEPLSSYVQERPGPDGLLEAWIDAGTGEVRKVVAYGVRTEDVRGWLDQAAAEASWTRDVRGRRAWLREDALTAGPTVWGRPVLCVEGEAPRRLSEPGLRPWRSQSGPGGWALQDGRNRRLALGADGPTVHELASESGELHLLSSRHGLWRGWDRKARVLLGWQLVDLAGSGTLAPAQGLESGRVAVIDVLDTDRVLTLVGAPGARRLCTWSPDAGVHEPLVWTAGAAMPVGEARLANAYVLGRRGDGSPLLHVGWSVDASGNTDYYALVAVDRGRRSATWIGPSSDHLAVAYEATGAVVVIEQCRRIVRLGPEPGQREVLFPR